MSETDKLLIAYALEVQGEADAAAKMEGFSAALDKTGQKTEEAAKKTESLKPAYDKAALGFSAAASGAASLYFQYDALEKRQLAVDRANKAVEVSNLSLSRAQEELSKLQADGQASALDLQQAQQKVAIETENVRLATEKARLAQGDYTQAELSFGLTVIPTVIGAVSGFRGALTALQGMKIANLFSSAAAAGGEVALTGALAGVTVSAGGATGALGALRMAMNFIAMHPILIPLMALSAIFIAISMNAFGVRDALNSLGVKLGELFPALKPFLDAIGTLGQILFPETQTASAELATGISTDSAQMTADINAMVAEHTAKLQEDAGAFDSLGTKVDEVRTKMAQEFKIGDLVLPEMGGNNAPPADSDFREIPNPIGAPIKVFDPIVGGFGGKRQSELAAMFQQTEEAKKAADEINAKYREIFPQLESHHTGLSESIEANVTRMGEFKKTVNEDTAVAKETVATNIGAITTEFGFMAGDITKTQEYMSAQLATLERNFDKVADNMVADAKRAQKAIEDLKSAAKDLGAAVSSGGKLTGGSLPQPVTIILQLDGVTIAQKTTSSGGTLKFV